MIISTIWDGDRAPLAKALVSAQTHTEAVKKAATNPAFKSRYADLATVVEALVPAYNAAGIAVLQSPSFDGETVTVATILLHESGASITNTLTLRPVKADPQGVGSAITYARRYALLAMAGAAPEDDDGNSASGHTDGRHSPQRFQAHQERPAAPDGPSDAAGALIAEVNALTGLGACEAWGNARAKSINDMTTADRDLIRAALKTKRGVLKAEETFRPDDSGGVARSGSDSVKAAA